MDIPEDTTYWDGEAKEVLLALEDTHLKQEEGPFDVNDILDMEFFKEDTKEIPSDTPPWSPEVRKKQKTNQPFTYPRTSKKKPVTFSTYRESSPKQKKTFWYNNRNKSESVLVPQTPEEIVVTFPLLNIKTTTSLLSSVPKLEDKPPHSYYFDPRTQPFYYPSSFSSVPSGEEKKEVSRFQLLEQPGSRQRKSYKNENRYIVPNPLTVCAKNSFDLPQIVRGVVSVRLVDKDGNPIISEKGNILESVDGSLSQPLYGPNLSTDFSLKVLQTSQGNMFRLLFTVSYVVDGFGNCEEKIFSRPFVVHSNRRKNSKEKPIVCELKPSFGPSSGGTEIWIKGIGFSEKVVVMFGDQSANIIESNENLLVVVVPPIDDEDRIVQVSVSNRYQQNELKSADKSLQFSYKSSISEGMDTEEQGTTLIRNQELQQDHVS